MKTFISLGKKYVGILCLTAFLLPITSMPAIAADNPYVVNASTLKERCEAAGGTFFILPDGSLWACFVPCGEGMCEIWCDEVACEVVTPDKKKPIQDTNSMTDILDGKITGERRFPWLVTGALVLIGIASLVIFRKRAV